MTASGKSLLSAQALKSRFGVTPERKTKQQLSPTCRRCPAIRTSVNSCAVGVFVPIMQLITEGPDAGGYRVAQTQTEIVVFASGDDELIITQNIGRPGDHTAQAIHVAYGNITGLIASLQQIKARVDRGLSDARWSERPLN